MGTITYSNVRHKDGEDLHFPPHERTPSDALKCIATADFGWGAHVSDVRNDGDRVAVETTATVMGCVDVTTYSGTPKDMHLILRLSELVTMMSSGERGEAVMKSAAQACANGSLGTPLMLSMVAPLVLGEKRTRGSLLMVLALEHYDAENPALQTALELGKEKLSMEDMLAAHELSESESMDYIEVLRMAMPL